MSTIFFDIDGTIFDGVKISKKVKKAIHKTQKKGHQCFICSGRPKVFIAREVEEMGFDGYILGNGSNIQYKDQQLKTEYLPYEYIKKVIEIVDELNLEYILLTENHGYLKKEYTYLHEFYERCNINFDRIRYDFNQDEVLHRIIKVEIYYKDDETYAKFNDTLNHFFALKQPDHLVEVSLPNVSKGSAIKELLEYLKEPIEDSYCFGDGLNDKEMFETVAHPIAMGNAVDEIKQLSEYVCDTVNNDGVAKELKTLFL